MDSRIRELKKVKKVDVIENTRAFSDQVMSNNEKPIVI